MWIWSEFSSRVGSLLARENMLPTAVAEPSTTGRVDAVVVETVVGTWTVTPLRSTKRVSAVFGPLTV